MSQLVKIVCRLRRLVVTIMLLCRRIRTAETIGHAAAPRRPSRPIPESRYNKLSRAEWCGIVSIHHFFLASSLPTCGRPQSSTLPLPAVPGAAGPL